MNDNPTAQVFEARTGVSDLPDWKYNDQGNAVPGEPLRWSAKTPPPALGRRVNAGHFGWGTIRGYFLEHGYLGVEVELEKPPAWLVKQWRAKGKGGNLARLFGIDLAEGG